MKQVSSVKGARPVFGEDDATANVRSQWDCLPQSKKEVHGKFGVYFQAYQASGKQPSQFNEGIGGA